jgi:hypothetical protein
MRIYLVRSSPPAPSRPVSSKGLLVAVILLIVLVPILFIAGIYYLSQPFIGTNVSIPTYTPSPSVPFTSSPPSQSPSSPSTGTYPTYTLTEAVSAGYVQANITGVSGFSIGTTGASSGDVIILHITRLVN